MDWYVEQQHKSGLGNLQWLKVAGPFRSRAEAEATLARREQRIGAPMRIVMAAR
jgi:cell division septation protein DedD